MELGSLYGKSTVCLARGMKANTRECVGKLHAYDKWRVDDENKFMLGQLKTGFSGSFRNIFDENVKEFISLVYATPDYISTLKKSTPISDHVPVDFELRGCPISKAQLVEVISAFLNGRKPVVPPHAVCMECKLGGTVCVMVAHGTPCLGPVTQAGCGSICPSYNRGCYGCFGPKETPNTEALSAQWKTMGVSDLDLVRAYRGFNAFSEAFRKESEFHEK